MRLEHIYHLKICTVLCSSSVSHRHTAPLLPELDNPEGGKFLAGVLKHGCANAAAPFQFNRAISNKMTGKHCRN